MPALSDEPLSPAEIVHCQLIKFSQRLALSEEFVKDVKLNVHLDPIFNQVLVDFQRKIPAVCGPDVTVPATWWDHVKDRFLRGYLRNRFPIRYRTFQARMYLPELPVPSYQGARTVSFPEVWRDTRTFDERMREEQREEEKRERAERRLRDSSDG